jgi:transposase
MAKKETIHQHAKRIHELSSTISEIARFEGKEFEDYDAEYLTSSASYLIDLISDWGPGEYDQKEKSRQLTLLRNFVKKWAK